MNTYTIVLFSVLILMVLSHIHLSFKGIRLSICFFVSLSLLFIIMALRSEAVGADTKQYCYAFTQIRSFSFEELLRRPVYGVGSNGWVLPLEYGYKLFNKFVSLFSSSEQAITVANSILIISMLLLLIKKNSPYPMLSVWLYITLGVFQTQMNTTRNAIAIFVVYLSFKFIKEKKILIYVICVIIAMSFHTSSIVYIAIYYLVNYIPLTDKRAKWILLFFSSFCFAFATFRPYLIGLVPRRYRGYFMASAANSAVLAVGVFHFGLILLVYILLRKEKRSSIYRPAVLGTWMFILDICSYCMASTFSFATRLAGLFGPYLIIFIPILIKNRTCTREEANRIIFLIIILTGVQYLIRISFNNIGSTMPYKFYWQ